MGFIIALVGFFFVNSNVSEKGSDITGVICGVMSAVTYFFMVVLNKKSNIGGVENSVIQTTAGFITVSLFILVKQGLAIDFSGVNWIAVIVLGVVNTG